MSNHYKTANKRFKKKINYPFRCSAVKCSKKIIMLLTKNNKNIPIDYDTLSEEDKYEIAHGAKIIFRKGEHMPHFATCTEPNRFRK